MHSDLDPQVKNENCQSLEKLEYFEWCHKKAMDVR